MVGMWGISFCCLRKVVGCVSNLPVYEGKFGFLLSFLFKWSNQNHLQPIIFHHDVLEMQFGWICVAICDWGSKWQYKIGKYPLSQDTLRQPKQVLKSEIHISSFLAHTENKRKLIPFTYTVLHWVPKVEALCQKKHTYTHQHTYHFFTKWRAVEVSIVVIVVCFNSYKYVYILSFSSPLWDSL